MEQWSATEVSWVRAKAVISVGKRHAGWFAMGNFLYFVRTLDHMQPMQAPSSNDFSKAIFSLQTFNRTGGQVTKGRHVGRSGGQWHDFGKKRTSVNRAQEEVANFETAASSIQEPLWWQEFSSEVYFTHSSGHPQGAVSGPWSPLTASSAEPVLYVLMPGPPVWHPCRAGSTSCSASSLQGGPHRHSGNAIVAPGFCVHTFDEVVNEFMKQGSKVNLVTFSISSAQGRETGAKGI